jgi:hypothetical protein
MTKFKFYLLSFTWGLPLTLVGCIVALLLLLFGHRPYRFGYCWYFAIGHNWGGLELGVIFLSDKSHRYHTLCHEHGHAIQNCYYGFMMPFLVCIPSAIRYWWIRYKQNRGHKDIPLYDSIWFERDATDLGRQLMDLIE